MQSREIYRVSSTNTFYSFILEDYKTQMGNLIARENVSSVMYSQSGTYTCKARRPGEATVEKSITVTVQCRMYSINKWLIYSKYSNDHAEFMHWKQKKCWKISIPLEQTSQCPSSPSDLICLSSSECNRCKRTSGIHEGCNAFSSTPVCDIDSDDIGVAGIQDTGDRKLAKCVPCKKDGKFIHNTGLKYLMYVIPFK